MYSTLTVEIQKSIGILVLSALLEAISSEKTSAAILFRRLSKVEYSHARYYASTRLLLAIDFLETAS